MDLDDELCLCFHITKRKVVNFIRIEKPRRAGEISNCFGAGTGCGWCRPFLVNLYEDAQEASPNESTALPDAAEYARSRSKYLDEKDL
jgi:NAD(P)H-nitrite reductase large subunit